jgi:hypothetical protein
MKLLIVYFKGGVREIMSKILKPKIEEVPIALTKMLFTIKIAYRGY